MAAILILRQKYWVLPGLAGGNGVSAGRGLDYRDSKTHSASLGESLIDRSLSVELPLERRAGNTSRKILVGVISAAFMFSSFVVLVGIGPPGSDKHKGELNSYFPHAPIVVSGDVDLIAQATASGWSGSGAPADPFMISGYYINGTASGCSISISNTTLNFVITSCHLEAWDCTAIELSNITRGLIQANLVSGLRPLVALTNKSSGVTLNNNTMQDDGTLDVEYADGITVSNNTFSGVSGASPSFRSAIRIGGYGYGSSSNDTRVENNTISNYSFGVGATSTNRLSVGWNSIIDSYGGLWIGGSSKASVSNNSVTRAFDGISLMDVLSSAVVNNTITEVARSGIRLQACNGLSLQDNQMVDGGLFIEGYNPSQWNSHMIDSTNTVNGLPLIYLLNRSNLAIKSDLGQAVVVSCTNVSFSGQSIANSTVAVTVAYSNHVNLDSLCLVDNDEFGILAVSSSDIVAANCSVRNSSIGISLDNCPRGMMTDCSFFGSNESSVGISVVNSNNCSISRCNVTSFRRDGVLLDNSADCVVKNCCVTSCGVGIETSSRRCQATGNYCANNSVGISLYAPASYGNRLDNNTLVHNGFSLDRDPSSWLGQAIEPSNSVNGKPLFYGQNLNGGTVPADQGQLILSNCMAMTINGYDLGNDSAGVLLYGSSSTNISNSSIDGNLNGELATESWEWSPFEASGMLVYYSWDVGGVVLVESSGNSIEFCDFTSNARGVYMTEYSNNNVVTNCSLESNEFGMVLEYDSDFNTITCCNISTSIQFGVKVYSSGFNSIHHNVFYRNNGAGDTYNSSRPQAWTNSWPNYWNDTSGGNYWSDWTAPDSDLDGIVDSPYAIIGWSTNWDYLPLASPPPVAIPEFSGGSMVFVLMLLFGIVASNSIVGRRR
jgi:parallel beta-helix repeat protein